MIIRLAMLSLAFATALASAQEGKERPAVPAGAERAAMLKSLQRGKEIQGGRARYEHVPQVLAVALSSPSETPEQAMARAGEGGAQLVEIKGRLVLFRSAQLKPASVGTAGRASVYPAVINSRSGALGVLTGTLIVKPKSMSDAEAIASGHGLEKAKAYPELRTVFYSAPPGVDIADLSAALQADPRVESAYPEIIEQVRVPR